MGSVFLWLGRAHIGNSQLLGMLTLTRETTLGIVQKSSTYYLYLNPWAVLTSVETGARDGSKQITSSSIQKVCDDWKPERKQGVDSYTPNCHESRRLEFVT